MMTGPRAATILLLLALIGGALLPWVACARATSVPAVSNVSLAIYVAGHFVCHQRPERSFASCGYQWPVCGRCAGLYLGAAAGVLIFGLWRSEGTPAPWHVWRRRLVISALPTALLWAGEFALARDPGTLLRFLGALPAGVGGAAWLVAVARGDLR